ncbi:NUDIX domain-containing protein [Priestia megaterium]|jgi:8-oxo-dGTP diphosphatase|uniref:NUDIX domain-containing protein n=1 Tax=Priestia megaterium TaxID=1404 RepID=UPI0021C0FE08|nr:NUDIX domain-containing protein [Priestia megaterium]MCT9852356.1 NUDIX domain-containing protein [Priestia megaterium]MDF1960902.1 NUDIX domain-containing protein [Priestia megaterium]MDF2012837.1 NUDIX domain-containing protein [Priestia megaterium]
MKNNMVFGIHKDEQKYITKIGSYAVIYDNQRSSIALIKNHKGDPFLPGGGLENGESLEDCVKRECLEEAGLKVSIQKTIGVAKQYFKSPNDYKYYLSEGHFYMCKQLSKQLPLEKDNNLLWVKPSVAIKMLVHDHHKWAISQLLR